MTVALEDAERLEVALADLAPAGWSERPYTDGAVVELWVPRTEVEAPRRLADALAARGLHASVQSATQDDEWRNGLRHHHHPIEIGGRLRVRPPWIAPLDGVIDIVIDPGMAFGTGQHATTKGCLTLLIDDPGDSLLDVGCGSGVLAIAASKLGYGPVRAIDNDPLAVAATIDNAAANGVTLEVGEHDAGHDPLPAVATLVANITAIPVIALAQALPEPPPRRVILSGFRPADVARVARAWAARGFAPVDRFDQDDWTALRLELTRP